MIHTKQRSPARSQYNHSTNQSLVQDNRMAQTFTGFYPTQVKPIVDARNGSPVRSQVPTPKQNQFGQTVDFKFDNRVDRFGATETLTKKPEKYQQPHSQTQ